MFLDERRRVNSEPEGYGAMEDKDINALLDEESQRNKEMLESLQQNHESQMQNLLTGTALKLNEGITWKIGSSVYVQEAVSALNLDIAQLEFNLQEAKLVRTIFVSVEHRREQLLRAVASGTYDAGSWYLRPVEHEVGSALNSRQDEELIRKKIASLTDEQVREYFDGLFSKFVDDGLIQSVYVAIKRFEERVHTVTLTVHLF